MTALAFLASTAAARRKAEKPAAEVGAKAPDFGLPDSQGKQRKLSDYKGKVVVLEWLNFDCPFSKKHYRGGNIQGLQKDYAAKDVVWLSIISSAPGKQGNYPPEDVNKTVKERGASPAAVLLDPKGDVGRLYDAKTTPDMYVIDPKGVLVYSGAIDDKPTTDVEDIPGARSYVREALDAVLAGKPVKTGYVKPYGCSVKY